MERRDLEAVLQAIGMNYADHAKQAVRDLEEFLRGPGTDRHGYFVAEADGEVVGCVGFIPDKDEEVENVVWAVWFYVRPDYQRCGVGRVLWEYMEAHLKALRVRKLYLDVGNESDHAVATSFYRKLGYTKEGELVDYFRDGENKQFYAKRLTG